MKRFYIETEGFKIYVDAENVKDAAEKIIGFICIANTISYTKMLKLIKQH